MARIRSVREFSDSISRQGSFAFALGRKQPYTRSEKRVPSFVLRPEKETRTVEETVFPKLFPSRSSRSVFQPIAPLKTRRGPTRTSSPSASTSSRSGYISSNTTSVS